MRKTVTVLMLLIVTTLASASTKPGNEVTITCYNAVAEQCSGDPLTTASGKKIDLNKLNRGELRYVAVSRDLLKEYKYGDKVDVYISEGHPYNGTWVVADTMHRRWNNKIDLLLSQNQKVGKWQGKLFKK